MNHPDRIRRTKEPILTPSRVACAVAIAAVSAVTVAYVRALFRAAETFYSTNVDAGVPGAGTDKAMVETDSEMAPFADDGLKLPEGVTVSSSDQDCDGYEYVELSTCRDRVGEAMKAFVIKNTEKYGSKINDLAGVLSRRYSTMPGPDLPDGGYSEELRDELKDTRRVFIDNKSATESAVQSLEVSSGRIPHNRTISRHAKGKLFSVTYGDSENGAVLELSFDQENFGNIHAPFGGWKKVQILSSDEDQEIIAGLMEIAERWGGELDEMGMRSQSHWNAVESGRLDESQWNIVDLFCEIDAKYRAEVAEFLNDAIGPSGNFDTVNHGGICVEPQY